LVHFVLRRTQALSRPPSVNPMFSSRTIVILVAATLPLQVFSTRPQHGAVKLHQATKSNEGAKQDTATGMESQLVDRLHQLRQSDENILKDALSQAQEHEAREMEGQKKAAMIMGARARVLEDVLKALGDCWRQQEVYAVLLSKVVANIEETPVDTDGSKKDLLKVDLEEVLQKVSQGSTKIDALRNRLISVDGAQAEQKAPSSFMEAAEILLPAELGQLQATEDTAAKRHQALNDAMVAVDGLGHKERALTAGMADIAKTRAHLLETGLEALSQQSRVHHEYTDTLQKMVSFLTQSDRSEEEVDDNLVHSLGELKLKVQTQAEQVHEAKTSIEDGFHMTENRAETMLKSALPPPAHDHEGTAK